MSEETIVKCIFALVIAVALSVIVFITVKDHTCREKGGVLIKGNCYRLEKIQ